MKPSYLLIDLAIYVGFVPCLVAVLNWKQPERVLWWLWAHLLVGTLLGVLAILLANRGINNHFIYPIMALLTGLLMGLFFSGLADQTHLKWTIRVLFALYTGYVLLTGFGKMTLFLNLELFTPLDVSVFGLSLFFLVNLLRYSRYLARKPLFWLLLALCLGSLYDIAQSRAGTLLAQYAGNRWLNIFWLQINPIVTICKHGLYTYGFYLTRFQLNKTEKLPQFL